MQTIVPYQESVLSATGGIISPKGDITTIYTLHEVFAKNYCNGEDYDYLKYIKYQSSLSRFLEFQKNYQYTGTKEDIDEWCHSKLNKQQLEQYKVWLKQYQKYHKSQSALDFMILALEFDKIESVSSHMITTTSRIPHVRFFNYYLMDWDILTLSKATFDSDKKCFEFHGNDIVHIYHSYSIDTEAEEEIQYIKSKTKREDLPYFFR